LDITLYILPLQLDPSHDIPYKTLHGPRKQERHNRSEFPDIVIGLYDSFQARGGEGAWIGFGAHHLLLWRYAVLDL